MKRPFLAAHDYGMGGTWMYIDAVTAEAITRSYPELTVFETPPHFLAPEALTRTERELHFDIDSPPTGYLAEMVAARGRDHGGRP